MRIAVGISFSPVSYLEYPVWDIPNICATFVWDRSRSSRKLRILGYIVSLPISDTHSLYQPDSGYCLLTCFRLSFEYSTIYPSPSFIRKDVSAMYCTKCGKSLDSQDMFCKYCGASIQTDAQPSQSAKTISTTIPKGRVVKNKVLPLQTWKEFYFSYIHINWVTWTIVLYFISAAIIPLAAFYMGRDLMVPLLHTFVYTAMGILLIITRHWAFAMLPMIIAIINLFLFADGSLSLAAIMSIRSTYVLIKGRRAYKYYRKTGELDYL